ncbi:MAG TPA: helix-turn-helix domain-containing protein [Polyangiaceae bacterium]|nr:helix-turn-helix domain-containing protein [Polyangiaceae bacterium]
MADSATGVDGQVATRLRELRAARGLSLEALAQCSGVSRSMLSVIERGESSATAALLAKVTAALGVTLASLFEPGPSSASVSSPLARRVDQPRWRDPESGYQRRSVSPPGRAIDAHIVEVEFPPGARVAFENGPRMARVHQQIWLLDGVMNVTVGDTRYRLERGDCLAMTLEGPTMFHNPTKRRARYAVIVSSPIREEQ